VEQIPPSIPKLPPKSISLNIVILVLNSPISKFKPLTGEDSRNACQKFHPKWNPIDNQSIYVLTNITASKTPAKKMFINATKE
jgi:DNA-binding IscR family transcriptional regulator